MSSPPVVALANQKGGVGKTTTTLNIAAALVDGGRRVLVVDCDPQASATVATGVDDDAYATLVDVYDGDAPMHAAVRQTSWGFDLVASEIALAKRESNKQLGDEHRLREALADPGLSDYDVVLLDCPPSLGLMTVGALTAAPRLVIVTEAGRFALRGMGDLLETVDVVRRYYNPRLEVAGVIVNLVDGTNVTRQRLAEITEFFPGQVWEPTIPRGVAAKEATDQGIPLSRVTAHRAQEYAALYERLARKMEEVIAHV